jgi:hypothetical protein
MRNTDLSTRHNRKEGSTMSQISPYREALEAAAVTGNFDAHRCPEASWPAVRQAAADVLQLRELGYRRQAIETARSRAEELDGRYPVPIDPANEQLPDLDPVALARRITARGA